jgi:hypothetical protein
MLFGACTWIFRKFVFSWRLCCGFLFLGHIWTYLGHMLNPEVDSAHTNKHLTKASQKHKEPRHLTTTKACTLKGKGRTRMCA